MSCRPCPGSSAAGRARRAPDLGAAAAGGGGGGEEQPASARASAAAPARLWYASVYDELRCRLGQVGEEALEVADDADDTRAAILALVEAAELAAAVRPPFFVSLFNDRHRHPLTGVPHLRALCRQPASGRCLHWRSWKRNIWAGTPRHTQPAATSPTRNIDPKAAPSTGFDCFSPPCFDPFESHTGHGALGW